MPLTRLAVAALLTLAVVLAPRAVAWNGAGHRIVATIAYDELAATNKPTLDAYVVLLKQHPRFREDFAANLPPEVAGTDDEPRWLFGQAATWPDMMRSFRLPKPVKDAYHHPTWHYVDKPLTLRGPDPDFTPATDPTGDPKSWNILQALQFNLKLLKDANAPGPDRAVALCWVLHTLGDVHQPLHCACLESNRFKGPDGDRGGNSILVAEDFGRAGNADFAATEELLKPATAPATPARTFKPELHGLWDGIVATNENYLPVDANQRRIKTLYPRAAFARELPKSTPPEVMVETFRWAKSTTYAPFILAAVARQEPADGAAPGAFIPVALNGTYLHTAEVVAEQRMALAGYRLADALTK